MTRKLSISVPDHIADYLDRQENASAAVVAALSREIDRIGDLRQMYERHGIVLTDAGRARSRAKLAAADRERDRRRAARRGAA
jgi:hypothetical protein